jgi:transposase-like protein
MYDPLGLSPYDDDDDDDDDDYDPFATYPEVTDADDANANHAVTATTNANHAVTAATNANHAVTAATNANHAVTAATNANHAPPIKQVTFKWVLKTRKQSKRKVRRRKDKGLPDGDFREWIKKSLEDKNTWLARLRSDNKILTDREIYILGIMPYLSDTDIRTEPLRYNSFLNSAKYSTLYYERIKSPADLDVKYKYFKKVLDGMERIDICENKKKIRMKMKMKMKMKIGKKKMNEEIMILKSEKIDRWLKYFDGVDIYDRLYKYILATYASLIVKCPQCLSQTKKNSSVKFDSKSKGERKEQKYKCKNCGYQFVFSNVYLTQIKQETFKGMLVHGKNLFVSYNQMAGELNVSTSTLLNWMEKLEIEYYLYGNKNGVIRKQDFTEENLVILGGMSRGYTAKALYNNEWYKLSAGAFNAQAEVVASRVAKHTNINEFVPYKMCIVNNDEYATVSNDFTSGRRSLTLKNLHSRVIGTSIESVAQSMSGAELLEYTCKLVESELHYNMLPKLSLLLQFDALVLNEDRHFDNILFVLVNGKWQLAPAFDFDRALFSCVEDLDNLNKYECPSKPYCSTHKEQVELMHTVSKERLKVEPFDVEQVIEGVWEDKHQIGKKEITNYLKEVSAKWDAITVNSYTL